MYRQRQIIRVLQAFMLLFFTGVAMAAPPPPPEVTEAESRFFETKIRPQLVKHCFGCHSAKSGKIRGGLRLDTKLGTLRGGNTGPAVVPNSLDKSLLWESINYEDLEMPPRGELPANVIADFRKWIEMGAPDPRANEKLEIRSKITRKDIEEGRRFWSFQPPKIKKPNAISGQNTWAMTEIDKYVLAVLQEYKLTPAKDADPDTVLRRLWLDLVGLPPTPDQIIQFSRKWKLNPQKAMESVVDSLLKSERFGERWGRHWLDVARYAESSGKEQNLTFPHAWRYRDYVIDSFNEDKPYDRFILEQIAGDLLPVETDEQWAENLVATGFLAIGTKTLVERNKRQFQLDVIDEQIDVTTRVVLGLSVACARCHDHKFDPIPQSDYYAMAGIFESTKTYYGTHATRQNPNAGRLLHLPIDGDARNNLTKQQMAALRKQLDEKRAAMQKLQSVVRKIRSGETTDSNSKNLIGQSIRTRMEIGVLQSRIATYDENGKAHTFCMATQDLKPSIDANLLVRGQLDKPAQKVPRGFPQVLSKGLPEIKPNTSGRLELAHWMTDKSNPLIARVMVNRVWLHLFGEGLVRTPEDFGFMGKPPSHLELLDYLAIRFMNAGWSVKKLIRHIVLSRVYRIDSKFDAAKFKKDPENKYLWRRSPRRLDAEVIRDSMLSISGQLDGKRPHESLVARVGPAAIRNGVLVTSTVTRNGSGTQRTTIEQVAESARYRSVYLPVLRDYPPRALELFDFAESSMVIGKRDSSNTPDQGLFFMNNPFVIAQCDAMAQRLVKEKRQLSDQIALAFQLAYSRKATTAETKAAQQFIREFDARTRTQQLSALCQAIIAAAEFRYLN